MLSCVPVWTWSVWVKKNEGMEQVVCWEVWRPRAEECCIQLRLWMLGLQPDACTRCETACHVSMLWKHDICHAHWSHDTSHAFQLIFKLASPSWPIFSISFRTPTADSIVCNLNMRVVLASCCYLWILSWTCCCLFKTTDPNNSAWM